MNLGRNGTEQTHCTSNSSAKSTEFEHGSRTPDNVISAQQYGGQLFTKQDEFDGINHEDRTIPWEKDAGNPHNWPKWQRVFYSAIPAAIAFVCTLPSSTFAPAIDQVMDKFGVSSMVAILPYSLYVLGQAFGPMIGAPCSEAFGRKVVYMFSMPTFALFLLGAGFSNSVASLSVCRFFAGLFSAPGLSIGSASIADIWQPAERAIPMTAYIMMPFLAPSLGPLLGGYAIMGTHNWRWTMWVPLLFLAAVLLPSSIFLRETYAKKIISDRQHYPGQRKAELKAAVTTPKLIRATPSFVRTVLLRPVRMLFEPIAGLFALYVAFNFGNLYIFFAVFPSVFEQVYGFNLGEAGLAFLGLGIGTLLSLVTIVFWSLKIYKPMAIQWINDAAAAREIETEKSTGQLPSPPPEWRLHIAFPGSVLVPTGLFIFAWTVRPDVHWIAPIIGMMCVGWGVVLIFMSAIMFVMDCYGPMYGASAMATNTLLRYIFGAAFPLFSRQMYKRLDVHWATSLLGFLAMLFMLIPPAFWYYGPWLRQKSRFGKP